MSGWEMVALGQVLADAKSGFACGEAPPVGVFQFRMNNITTEGGLDFSKIRRVPANTRNIDSFLLEPGDVLFNATNSPELVGKSAFFSGYREPAVFSNHFLRLRPDNDRLDGRFLARWLNLQFQRRIFQGLCRQWVNQATVSRDALLALHLPLPPLDEQRRIAAILDQADALRAKRRTALALLDTLTQSIFMEMFGDPATNPKGWPQKTIGDIAAKYSDGPFGSNLKTSHYTSSGVRVIRLQNIGVGEFIDTDKAYVSERHFTRLSRHECMPGDVLIGTLGDPNLRACIQPSWLKVALNKADCVQLRPNTKIVNAHYVCALLNHPSTERMAQDLVLGQTRLRISMGRLRGLKIPVPPIGLQEEFANCIAAVETLKATHYAAIGEVDALFASLQHRAFHGEL